jgi:uncharacterized protein YggE
MKSLKQSILILLIAISFSFAQDSLQNVITTFGKVELKVPADYATVSFSITSEGESLRDAVNKAKKKVIKVTKDLFTLGLNEKNISTSRFYSGENFGGKSFFSSNSDFKTEINTYLKIDSLDMIENILLTLSDHKVDEISNISFSLKNPEKYKLEAIEKAISKAKEKAILLSKVMGSTISNPFMITELNSHAELKNHEKNIYVRGGRSYPNPFNAIYMVDGASDKSRSIFSESIKIVAEVKLQVSIK